jgi:hypothetical protein
VRAIGQLRPTHVIDPSSANISAVNSLANQPGASAFTRTPLRAHCTASSRLKLTAAPFEAQYDACRIGADATRPSIDDTLTIDPEPLRIISRPTRWHIANIELRFTSITRRKWSTDSSSAGIGSPMPALFTSTSMRPAPASRARATSASQSASTVTSHPTGTSREPSSAASSSSRSVRRAAATTVAPAPWSTSANRRPRPLDAPVTTAVRPSSENRDAISAVVGIFRTLGVDLGRGRSSYGQDRPPAGRPWR